MNPGYLSALVNAFIYRDGMPIVIIKKKITCRTGVKRKCSGQVEEKFGCRENFLDS